jgi:putative oxidoreductase
MNDKIKIFSIYILGLIYFVFGLNGFLNFIPQPKDAMPEAAMTLMNGFIASGYMFPLIKGTEVIGGLMLLAGFWRPLALILLAPVTINILLFHGLLTPGIQFIVMPLVMVALHILAATKYRDQFKPLFNKG